MKLVVVYFICSLFESALKTNDSLDFTVITGCLRISRESIFTGLNNLDIISVLNEDYAEYFGFTQDEVDSFLEVSLNLRWRIIYVGWKKAAGRL